MFWSNILSIRQLEDLFLIVNNLKSSIREPFSNISCVQPAFTVEDIRSSLGVSVVSPEHVVPHNADLPLALGGEVLHVRNILYRGFHHRILYGNETDVNEYPWQISMWIDRSHFCGGTLITDQWVATAAHCVDLHYRRHFSRITVSLGDH